ncbi:MAG: hypothetical protein NXY57DRAFT_856299, partial [Lentinula lateritia]
MHSGHQLRSLFATILKDCRPSQLLLLWNEFKDDLCDDVQVLLHNSGILDYPSQDEIFDYGLY